MKSILQIQVQKSRSMAVNIFITVRWGLSCFGNLAKDHESSERKVRSAVIAF